MSDNNNNNTKTTTAVNRSLSDLHTPTWLALLSSNIIVRTIFFHPINLAIARKRVSQESKPPSLVEMIKLAYHGNNHNLKNKNNNINLGVGGIRGSYRGVGAAMFCNVLGEVSFLWTLETLKESFLQNKNSDNNNNMYEGNSVLTALGAMAGDAVALITVTPFVIVANRQMTAQYGLTKENHYKNVSQTFRQVWQTYQNNNNNNVKNKIKSGLRGLYQGTSAGLLRIPSSGVWWYSYSKTKELLYEVSAPFLAEKKTEWERTLKNNNNNENQNLNIFQRSLLSSTDNPILNAAAGTVASVLTTLLFNPLQVIQVRQQTLATSYFDTLIKHSNKNKSLFYKMYASSFQKTVVVARDIAEKEGLKSFFKGVTANVSVAVADGIIFSLLFEFTKLGSDVSVLKEYFS
ncbi:mitochondrial carrier protein [Angomonas deanei]|nr:mitochondrial carrier protein [Angomonas deanei]|eukprot:EPY34380.1 mitochondrial carrier protein [Angomonas deanei]